MKKIVSIVLALVMVLSLTACSGSASGTTAAGNDKETQAAAGTNETAEPVEIVAIAKSIATSSWQLFGTGCKAAAAELGDKVEFTFDGASSSTALEESLNLIENYLANGCDAIVVATDASGAGALLTNAQKDGVSVIIADNTLPGISGHTSFRSGAKMRSGLGSIKRTHGGRCCGRTGMTLRRQCTFRRRTFAGTRHSTMRAVTRTST